MRESMARLTPLFASSRAVREYSEQFYLPAAATYLQRAVNKGTAGKQMIDWLHELDRKWGSLRFGDVRVETNAERHLFEVTLFLNNLDPNAVQAELYADRIDGGDVIREEMKCTRPQPDASGACVYHATVPSARPASDYTARLIPQRSGVAVPFEFARILWQR